MNNNRVTTHVGGVSAAEVHIGGEHDSRSVRVPYKETDITSIRNGATVGWVELYAVQATNKMRTRRLKGDHHAKRVKTNVPRIEPCRYDVDKTEDTRTHTERG